MPFKQLLLIPLLLLPACQSEAARDNRSIRLEIPLQADTTFSRQGGEDGANDHSIVLREQVLRLHQSGQELRLDLKEFPGDVLVVHGTGLIPPVMLTLPGVISLTWHGRKLRIGEQDLRVPRKGSFRYDRSLGTLVPLDG